MIKLLVLAAALGLSGSAIANASSPVPLCSRTVTDECMNPSQAHHARAHHVRAHHKAHHARRHVAHRNMAQAHRG